MSNDEQTQEVVEVLHGINITNESIELFVTSTGYTTKNDFRVDVNTGFTGQSPVEITVFRIKSDNGKMMPHVVQVAFSKKELGIDGLFAATLTNKLGNNSSGR